MRLKKLPEFEAWLRKLKDARARQQIADRLVRLEAGNLGDWAPVGEGVSELRIHSGPGYRVYFTKRGRTWCIILGGGDKGTQSADIARAQTLARQVALTKEEWKHD